MKELIVITQPNLFSDEAEVINALFNAGLQRLHLRKPNATQEAVAALIEQIPACYHPQIVLHDHFELNSYYQLGGVHLNRRNPTAPKQLKGTTSRSCHTLEEITAHSSCDYLFLSPLFDSISKEGYGATFTMEQLTHASNSGIISPKVIALGGMDATRIPTIQHLPFGGIAVLGALWGDIAITGVCAQAINELIQRFEVLKNILK